MKKIEAIIRESKFQNVKTALTKLGVRGMTTYPVRGRGDQIGEEDMKMCHMKEALRKHLMMA